MKKSVISAAFALALMTGAANGEPAKQIHYSSSVTPIGTLLADPAAKVALGRRFPMLLQSKAVAKGMANRMTLRTLKRFKPAIFTDAALAAIDVDFANMPGR